VRRAPLTRRRLLAVVALVLAPLAVLNAVGYAADDPQQPFGLLTTLSLALVIGGFGLVRRGAIRVIALVLAAVLVAGALDQLLDRRLVDRLIVGGMLWLAVAAAFAAFLTPRALAHSEAAASIGAVRQPALGRWQGRALRARRRGQRGIEPVELTPGDDLATLASKAADDGADGLAMAGGDGSQAVAGQRGLPYACIPPRRATTSRSTSAWTATTSSERSTRSSTAASASST
jgi:hypothetical protein